MRPRGQGRLAVAAAAGMIFSGLYAAAQQTGGGGGVPGGNTVSSVFSRTGDVQASAGDYKASQVTSAADVTAPNTFSANQTITGADKLTFGSATVGISLSNAAMGNTSAFQINDAQSGLFLVNATEPDGNPGDGGFAIPDNAPIVWATPASTPTNAVGALTWVTTGKISLDTDGDGSGSGWLMVSAIGNGAGSNTDLRGKITLSSGSGSYTFSKTYAVAPICVATDTTTAAPIKVTITTTAMTLTGTGSDVLNYVCAD